MGSRRSKVERRKPARNMRGVRTELTEFTEFCRSDFWNFVFLGKPLFLRGLRVLRAKILHSDRNTG